MVAVGSYGGSRKDLRNKKAEVYEEGIWTSLPDYPMSGAPTSRIAKYATVFFKGGFLFFGGLVNGNQINNIARLDSSSWTWTQIGNHT